MARVKRGVTSRSKHKKVLKAVKGQCGRDREGDYSDCKNNGRDPVVGMGGGDRARSEYYSSQTFNGEKWHSVSIFIPNDFKSVDPVSTSFFQFYEREKKKKREGEKEEADREEDDEEEGEEGGE